MSAHTPGPWERRWTYRNDTTGRIVGDERRQVVAELNMANPNVDADARLLAAAPNLLAALRELLDLGGQESIEDGELEAAQRAARSAIALATGGRR